MKTIWAFIGELLLLFVAWLFGVSMTVKAAENVVTPREDYKDDATWKAAKDNLFGDLLRNMFGK